MPSKQLDSALPGVLQPQSVDDVVAMLEGRDYVADRRLATSVFLALKMSRPLKVALG